MRGLAKTAREPGALELLDDSFFLLEADEAFEAFLASETVKPLFDVSVLRE